VVPIKERVVLAASTLGTIIVGVVKFLMKIANNSIYDAGGHDGKS